MERPRAVQLPFLSSAEECPQHAQHTHLYQYTCKHTYTNIHKYIYICIYSVYITYILINKDRHIFSHLLRNVHSLYSYIHVDTYTNTYNAPSLFDLIFGPRGQHSRYDIIIMVLIKMIILRVRNVIRAAAPHLRYLLG